MTKFCLLYSLVASCEIGGKTKTKSYVPANTKKEKKLSQN